MKEKNALIKVADAYAENTPIRILATTSIAGVALINPIAGIALAATDQIIVSRVFKLGAKNARTFFDEVNKHEHLITEELLEDDDFIYASVSILNASIRTRREKKIHLFARLLINSTRGKFYKTDEFEEFVAILDGLSMREFNILNILKKYQDEARGDSVLKQREVDFIFSIWDNFINDVSQQLDLVAEEIPALLIRLPRTGLYSDFAGKYINYQNEGMLTSLFYKFIEKLMDDYIPEKPKT